jgi:hypothetical protein
MEQAMKTVHLQYWLGEREFGQINSSDSLDKAKEIIDLADKAQKKGTWRNIRLTICQEYDAHYVGLIGQRLETQEEAAERAAREKSADEAQEAKDRAIYEQLKKKFEGVKP